jgi:hypothetical protein
VGDVRLAVVAQLAQMRFVRVFISAANLG